MAKDKTETPAERAARKAAKAAKKDSKPDDSILHDKVTSDGVKKTKKDKHKDKKEAKKLAETAATAITSEDAQAEEPVGVVDTNGDATAATANGGRKVRPAGPVVTFADPLADEKGVKRLLKGVERSAKAKTLKRGVKEVNKAIRFTPAKFAKPPEAVCVIAGDISPMDVISHIPVSCEKHFIPYVFVPSRDKLGQAGLTTRPTSVVLLCKEMKGMKEEDKAGWSEEYASLCKVAENTKRRQPILG